MVVFLTRAKIICDYMLPDRVSARAAQTGLKFQLEFWSCNRLLCFNSLAKEFILRPG
jgi:hypothetical protein